MATRISLLCNLSLQLLEHLLSKQDSYENPVFAPVSLYFILADLLSATTDTVNVMNVFQVLGVKTLNEVQNNVLEFEHEFQGSQTDEPLLFIRNLLMANQPMNKGFVSKIQQSHSFLDIADTFSLDSLNSWVYDATNGMIEQLDLEFPNSVDSVLIASALAFEDKWVHPFEKLTKKLPFTLQNNDSDTKTISTMFMSLHNTNLHFSSIDTSDTVILPFKNGCFAYFTLSTGSNTVTTALHDLVNFIGGQKLHEQPMHSKNFDLKLPTFSIQSNVPNVMQGSLEPLSNMSLEKIAQDNSVLRLQQVSQSVHITVTPEGAKAAAVTVAVVGR
eukprot:1904295-Rhodomonas_salina.3